jgi:hypothetical protein
MPHYFHCEAVGLVEKTAGHLDPDREERGSCPPHNTIDTVIGIACSFSASGDQRPALQPLGLEATEKFDPLLLIAALQQ